MPNATPSRAGLPTIGSADGFGGRERLRTLDRGPRGFESGFLQRRVIQIQPSTPPGLPLDTADIPRRSDCSLAKRCRSCMTPDQFFALSARAYRCRDKAAGPLPPAIGLRSSIGRCALMPLPDSFFRNPVPVRLAFHRDLPQQAASLLEVEHHPWIRNSGRVGVEAHPAPLKGLEAGELSCHRRSITWKERWLVLVHGYGDCSGSVHERSAHPPFRQPHGFVADSPQEGNGSEPSVPLEGKNSNLRSRAIASRPDRGVALTRPPRSSTSRPTGKVAEPRRWMICAEPRAT
jgi:hypothetical protein